MKRILIVEDNPLNMELVSDLLEAKGFLITQAESAEEGLDYCRQQLFELILMDVRLPGMDGVTAIRILKSLKQTKHIPVIALTAHALESDRQKISRAGANGYVRKPIEQQLLLAEIHRQLRVSVDPVNSGEEGGS